MSDFKAKLSSAQWRKMADVMIDVGGEELPAVIRRAPEGVAVLVLKEAREAGELNEKNEPIGEDGAMRLLSRMGCTVLFQQGAVRPAFDRNNPEDVAVVMTSPWLMGLRDSIMLALGTTGAGLEKSKGNSEATPTGL